MLSGLFSVLSFEKTSFPAAVQPPVSRVGRDALIAPRISGTQAPPDPGPQRFPQRGKLPPVLTLEGEEGEARLPPAC